MTNPLMNYTILMDALLALKEGNIRQCEALGFSYSELEALNNLSVDELFHLCRTAAQFMSVTIKHDVLRQLLARGNDDTGVQLQIYRAVSMGGSIELLGQYFGLSSGEVCARRRFLSISVSQGRSRVPDEETDARIWREWQQLRPPVLLSLEALDVMMDITEMLSGDDMSDSLSLTVVWNRIMQCEQELTERRAHG